MKTDEFDERNRIDDETYIIELRCGSRYRLKRTIYRNKEMAPRGLLLISLIAEYRKPHDDLTYGYLGNHSYDLMKDYDNKLNHKNDSDADIVKVYEIDYKKLSTTIIWQRVENFYWKDTFDYDVYMHKNQIDCCSHMQIKNFGKELGYKNIYTDIFGLLDLENDILYHVKREEIK